MRKAVMTVGVALMIAGMAPAAMASDTREDSGDYVAVPPAHVLAHHRDTPDPAPNAGGQSFDVLDGDEAVSVQVDDEVNENVRSVLAFYDDDEELISGHGFCTSIDDQAVPEDAASATVFVAHDTYFAVWGWGEIGDCNLAPPTAGTVTAVFS